MSILPRSSWLTRVTVTLTFVFLVTLSSAVFASMPQASISQVSSDPYTDTASQHQSEVEPDSYANGSTIVAAIQAGRFTDGGSSNIGWATSTDSGTTWQNGFLPGTTVYATPPGEYARISDSSVTYDAAHKTWMISSLGISSTFGS